MIFKEYNKKRMIEITYNTTWPMDYSIMLDFIQVLIDSDFGENIEYFATDQYGSIDIEELKYYKNNVRKSPILKNECGNIEVAGYSKILDCLFKISLYNQTRVVVLSTPSMTLIEKNGEHAFDNYLNSLEIKAYCEDTKRTTIKEMKNKNV